MAQIKMGAKEKYGATKVQNHQVQDLVLSDSNSILGPMKRWLINFCILGFSTWAHAGLLYTYNQLTVMELDQMSKLVQEKLKEAKSAAAKTVPLKEGFQAVFSRPDHDRMIEKVVGPLRFELQDLGEYERIITELTEEAINALKNTRNFKPAVQVTYLIFLENLMADIKDQALQNDGFERQLFKKIQKAKIKLTQQAENEKNLKGLKETKSPSETAALVLESIEKSQEEAQKATTK
ncbi:MAG: hypothetical protein ACK5Y2_06460 [Bdellovibrionales bacterium]